PLLARAAVLGGGAARLGRAGSGAAALTAHRNHSAPHLAAALHVMVPAHSGTSCLRLTLAQVPVSQVRQGVSQALLQQTPSAQKVDVHSLPLLHSSPFFLGPPAAGPHAPAPLQVSPPVHSAAGSMPWA